MSSGMNVEKAKEYAKTMTYSRAVSNCYHAKGIMYRKATLIKLRELAELADRLDQMDGMEALCDDCIWHICNYNKMFPEEPQTEMDKCDKCKWWNYSYGCSNKKGICDFEQADTPQTDCDTCKHYKLACELFSEICKYEPITQTETQNSNLTFDTPQTERSGDEQN